MDLTITYNIFLMYIHICMCIFVINCELTRDYAINREKNVID